MTVDYFTVVPAFDQVPVERRQGLAPAPAVADRVQDPGLKAFRAVESVLLFHHPTDLCADI